MPDALMFQEEMYVLLMPGEEEVFLTADELLEQLKQILQTRQDDLPRDLQRFTTLEDQAKHLRDTACEFELRPGEAMQWYVVRLEK
ncbi:MAG TPA: chlororespiratory reduction protein 7 [Trichocoleus sp.]